jgi:hypothetical protein
VRQLGCVRRRYNSRRLCVETQSRIRNLNINFGSDINRGLVNEQLFANSLVDRDLDGLRTGRLRIQQDGLGERLLVWRRR